MTDSKYDINKGKELYKTVTSLSNLNRTEDDFLGKLQDQEYAKKVYNTFKDENLLGAKDEQSFLDSLGFNKASQPIEPKQPVDKPFDINLADTIPDVNIPKIKPETPKALQSTAEDFKMEFKERNLLPNPMAIKDITKISDIVGETPAERLQAQINTLGGDAITNMAKAEALSADIDKQLDELNKQYGAFLSEYEIKRNEIIPNVNDPWTPAMPALFGKRKANADYLSENEKLYNEINKKQQALFRQKELINTYKQYAEFGRQLEVGKRMSTLVSDGKITEDTMNILRSDGSQKSKDEYLTRLYDRGEIDKDTLRELYNLGDLTKNNEFLYGTFKTGNWNDILSMGMNEIARDLDITGIVRDIKAGKEVTEEEANTLNLYLKLSEIQDKASGENKEYGWWFNAGLGFQQSLRFIAEMGLSAGVFGAPTAGMKSFGIKGAKALIEKYGAKQATKMIMGKAGQVAAEGAYNTALRIPAMPSMYSNWSDRVLNLEMNKDDVSYWDHLNAVRGAYVDTFTAMFSETLGGVLDDLPLFTMMTKGKASKPLIETLFNSLSKISSNEAFNQTADILKNVGITGIPGEIVSELSDNLMNGILNLDSSQLSAFTDWDFYKEVALTSFIMGGAGGAANYFAGGVGAVVQSKKMQKEYEDAILSLNNTEFGDERMNALKNELLEAMARQQYVTTDKSSNERGVADIVMDMNSLYQSSVPQTKDKNAWMTWMKEGNKLSLADKAVRTGAYRYGEQQVIKDYVALNLGVAKDENGNVIPMDFEHEDGNVYEFTDTQGNNYFILDGTDDTVVLVDRATGEKIVKSKSFTDIGTITQTNANHWAMNTMLRNTQAWSARGIQASQQVKDDNFIPATSLEIDGIIVPVKSYDPKTDTYTITDGKGDDVEVKRTDPDVVEVDVVPTAANELSQNGVDPELEREIVTAGQNLPPVVETPPAEGGNTPAPVEGQNDTAINADDEVDADGFKKDKDGKRIWASQPTQNSKEFIDKKLGLDQGRKYVKDQIKEAKKALNAVSKNTSTNLDLDERFKELEAIEAQKKAAQDNLDYWTEIDKLYDAPQANQDTTAEITAETEAPVNAETTAPVEPEVETEVNAVPYEQMTSEDAKARIDAEQGENAFSFVDIEQAKAAKALERAEKLLSMSKNATSDVRKKYEQDVVDRKKDLQFWNDVLNLYTQSNTSPDATTRQTGQVPQNSERTQVLGEGHRGTGEGSTNGINNDGETQGETERDGNNRQLELNSKEEQDKLRKEGIKFEEAFDNIRGKGSSAWRQWVDKTPREAPIMQTALQKAQIEAKKNGGYISDELYDTITTLFSESKKENNDAFPLLSTAMIGDKVNTVLKNIPTKTYLGERGIKKGKIYSINTLEELFREIPKMDSDIAELADKVFSICKNLGIGVVFTDNNFKKNVIGYSSNRNSIRLKVNYLNSDISVKEKKALYLHEAIHAVTTYALEEKNYSGLPMHMRKAVDELNNIYKDLKNKGLLDGWYGGTNVKEMVAEMANPLFRAHLKSINAFKDIVNAITKFFVDVEVFGSSNTNAFEQVNNALNKLLDLFNKELYDNYNMSTDLFDISEEGSIDTMYESVGLRYEKGENGETIIRNENGDIVDEVTEDMINDSPLGASLKDAVKNGMISEEDRKQQLEFFKGLFNLQLRVNDLDLIYAVSGAIGFQPVEPGPRDMSKSDINGKKQPFAAITSNADKQYSTTIDFTTICKKTQAVINNMSTIMVKLGRGLTKEEIVDIVFKNTHKAGEPVPCPVCYVFSRWVGLGGLFDNIKSLQEKYKDADVEQLQKDIDILNEKVDNIAKSRGLKRSKAKDNLRKSIQNELNAIRFKEEKGNELTRKEKSLAKMLEEQLFQIDNLTWLTDVRLAEGYKPVPDNILFDINAGVEFASEYPLTWKFRTTRGPSMGKAASPYSPLHFGQVMLGIGKSDLNDIKDPSNNTVLKLDKNGEWSDETKEQVEKSRVKAKIQNLLNGQRLQSTSDWRFEYALDQLLAMLELQNIGAKAQLYTKVAEAIPFFASCNAEVNCSLMPKGDGYKENEDGTMELVFSRVTGMDERDAFMYSNNYDNVQPILVGINDTHMRLAMNDDRITFIIPFHASGGAEAQYKSMMQALEERFDDKREDYSPYQSDRRLPEGKRSEGQNIAYDLRYRILNSKKTGDNADTGVLNESERAILEDNDILRNLYERFFGKTIDGKEIKEKDKECYLVTIPGDQAELIFPYEYWDKTSTIETADVNGSRFISYCNTLGIIPRFSGVNSKGTYKAEKDFTNEKGYWKTLIDRRMYNNDGSYHIQKPVDVTNMDASYIDPKTPRPEIHTPSRSNDPTKEAEVVEKSINDINEAEVRAKNSKSKTAEKKRKVSPISESGMVSTQIDELYPNWMEGTTKETGKKGHSTQVAKTVGTYNKVAKWIENNLGKDVEILDASSGMGLGTQSLREQGFNIEDVEPYQSAERKQNNPATYSSYNDIDKQYDYIISNAVLNVIPDDWRADVLHDMASRMKDGGKLFINTRKSGEEKSIKDKIELDSPQEVLVKLNGKISSYQKFFTPQELKSWVEQELGDGYTVEIANEKNSGTTALAAVVVTKQNNTDSKKTGNQIIEEGASINQQSSYSTNTKEMSWWDKQVFKLQDRMRPVKLIMDEVLKRKGVIDETSDPHSQEVLSTSRADAEIQQFKSEKFEPMSKAIADGMKVLIEKMNMTATDARNAINDLLYARHALERNKHICVGEIEQRMMDGVKVALRVLVDRKTNADLANRYATIGGTLQLANIPYGAVESARQNAGNIYNETLMDSNMMDAIHELAVSAYDAQFNGTATSVNTKNLTPQQKELFNILENVAHNKAKAISKDTVIDMKTGKKVVVANNRSGMSDAEARKIISDYYTAETKGVMDEISARVKDATNFTLDKWLEYGLINKEEYDKYKTQYEYYIPLRGWEDKEEIDYTELPSKQFNMASELINLNSHADGRWSRADNPLAYIASLAMSACITGNRNLIRQHAFNMIDKNAHKITDLAVIENTYELYNDAGKLIGLTRKAPSKAMFDKGLVKVRKDLSYHWNKTSSQLGAHRVPVMIDGVRHVMYFKGKLGAQAAIAINGTGNDTRNVVLQQMAKWTRAMSSLMTGKNIYFLTKNTIRDLMFGNFAYFVENGYGKGLKLNKNFGIAFNTAFKDALGDTSDPLYQEFKRNGGQTGYVQLESIDKLGKEMEKMIKEAGEDKNKAVISVRKAATIMEAIGKASENAMRFAVYKLERENGSSEREAAIRAKEITVNFNRQGKNTKGFSSVYAFFNPAVQGTFRFFKLAAEHPKRFTAAMGTMFALKMMTAWACQAFSGSGDDDEPTAYDNLSDYVKATNYCIPLGAFNDDWKDKFLCIPIAQSVRAPLSIADGLLDVMTGKKDFNEVMKEYMLFNIGEFAPFDIDAIDLTGDEPISSAVQAFTPTPVRPIVEAYVLNRDFMGNPVHKEPYLRDDDITPQHQLAFNSTTPFLVGTSKMLNKLAGGDEKRSAGVQISQNGHIERSGLNIFDINPASVEHVLSGYFGGPAKVFIDLYNVGYGAVSEDVEINNDSYPIINQILKEPTSKPGYKDFYDMIEDGKLIEDTYGKYTPAEKPEIYSNPYNQKILALSKSAGDFVRNKNREIQATTDKEKKEALVNERDKRVREAAKEYKEIKEKYGK